jgi:phosphoserine phosphatase
MRHWPADCNSGAEHTLANRPPGSVNIPATTMSAPIALPGLTLQRLALPQHLSSYKAAAFDMDSTLINIECIDEIADAVGKKAEVAAITEAAMRGEITDFKDSLRRRVALLKGVPAEALEEVYFLRLRLNPGAEVLMKALKAAGLRTMLVSGGFTHFADRVRARLDMDEAHSNTLAIEGGLLTGEVLGDIVDGEAKKQHLLRLCREIGCEPRQAIAVGDGANDLPMMGEAGLSVAYHAKPKVREQAMVGITEGGLDRLLGIFG